MRPRICSRTRPRWRASSARSAGAVAVAAALSGCPDEKPPTPARELPTEPSAAKAVFKPAEMPAVLTYAGDRGEFADTNKVEAVPEEAKGFVRVALLAQGDPPPPGHVWVAHLGKPQAEGEYALTPVPRDLFEELALGQGRSSRIVLPGDLEPPRQLGTSGGLIVYKTAWCGVCKQLESYLERKGVEYVAKDIEHDREAAAELRAKAQAKGMNAQSVPVIDVNGELIVGFDRARLEKLL